MIRIAFVLFFTAIILSAPVYAEGHIKEGGDMDISSPEFANNGFIPKKFTCQGENISPGLNIKNIPPEAKSLALLVDDPDAPMGTWVHWVIYNVPIISRIEENSSPGIECITDFGTKGYGGPCPPSGTHRYFFKAYALDIKLDIKEGAVKKDLENAMKGHIIEEAVLIGLYKKQ